MKTVALALIIMACITSHGSNAHSADRKGITASVPKSCTLAPAEHGERISEFGALLAKRDEVRELDDGYALRFAGDDATTSEITGLVTAERRCCSFLAFELRFAADHGPIWLTVRGSEEIKTFMGSLIKSGSE